MFVQRCLSFHAGEAPLPNQSHTACLGTAVATSILETRSAFQTLPGVAPNAVRGTGFALSELQKLSFRAVLCWHEALTVVPKLIGFHTPETAGSRTRQAVGISTLQTLVVVAELARTTGNHTPSRIWVKLQPICALEARKSVAGHAILEPTVAVKALTFPEEGPFGAWFADFGLG